ncbi:uncharacterized protein EI90DRAFT_2900825, partial [Cantharellus anzutake]|uniref:uncharacterized protein n=1 Tax=Cantharellus anzutake TaxID=1750568 RepID=UPI0019040C7B
SLPVDAQASVDKMLQQKQGLISSCGREQVHLEDVLRLTPGQWLNDEIINFYGAMVMERAERWHRGDFSDIGFSPSNSNPHVDWDINRKRQHGDPLQVHYFNTFFYSKLSSSGYEKARLNKWTKKVDIFAKDALLIPINLGNSHWTFACINLRRKRIEYFDSLGRCRSSVYEILRDYLDKEHIDKKKIGFSFDGWRDYFSTDTPQQENAFDCGVFMCQFMEAASRGEEVEDFAFRQENMPYLRRRMLWEIRQSRLISWKV